MIPHHTDGIDTPPPPSYTECVIAPFEHETKPSRRRRHKKEKLQEMPTLKFVKLSKCAKTPTRSTPNSAGLDLYSAYDVMIPAFGKGLVHTDLQIECPPGTYARLAPKSGLSWFHSIHIGAGVIDADYRGNIMVVVHNLGNHDFVVKSGDPIAQLICEHIVIPMVQEVTRLSTTIRSTNGFGL